MDFNSQTSKPPFEESGIFPDKFISHLQNDFSTLLELTNNYSYSPTIIAKFFSLSKIHNANFIKQRLFIFVLYIGKINDFFDLHLVFKPNIDHFNFFFSPQILQQLISNYPKTIPTLTQFTEERFRSNFIFALKGQHPLSLRYSYSFDDKKPDSADQTMLYFETELFPAILKGAKNTTLSTRQLLVFCNFIFETIYSSNCQHPENIIPFIFNHNRELLTPLSLVFLESFNDGIFFDENHNQPKSITDLRVKTILKSILQYPEFTNIAFKNNLIELEQFYDIKYHIKHYPEYFMA